MINSITKQDLFEIAQVIADEIQGLSKDKWIRGLRGASGYAKISRPRLEKLLKSGAIRGYINNDESGKPTWIVDRDSIDAYHDKYIDKDKKEIKLKVKAYLQKQKKNS